MKLEDKIAKGTGFFMTAKIKEKQLKFFCTNFHVINKEYIDSNLEINIYYGKKSHEIKKNIQIKDLLNVFNHQKMLLLLKL
jgi:ABC-type lipoprotein export system ATPase subunit